jgi:hypothetical protein
MAALYASARLSSTLGEVLTRVLVDSAVALLLVLIGLVLPLSLARSGV